jgi:hypothetical protein
MGEIACEQAPSPIKSQGPIRWRLWLSLSILAFGILLFLWNRECDIYEFFKGIFSYTKEASVIALYVIGFNFEFVLNRRKPTKSELGMLGTLIFILLVIYLTSEFGSQVLKNVKDGSVIAKLISQQTAVQ